MEWSGGRKEEGVRLKKKHKDGVGKTEQTKTNPNEEKTKMAGGLITP